MSHPPRPASPVADPGAMLRGMTPTLRDGRYIFAHAPGREDLLPQALAMFREAEGLSLLLPEAFARAEGFDCTQPMALVTLGVWSALDGIGLTAAVATALATEGIPANVVAAFHHDHILLPEALAPRALATLQALAAAAR